MKNVRATPKVTNDQLIEPMGKLRTLLNVQHVYLQVIFVINLEQSLFLLHKDTLLSFLSEFHLVMCIYMVIIAIII